MIVSIIVAAAENNIIGADGDMPWRLSTDLKRFKALTLGKPLIMGRKTFDSIGKPLPGRTSIVVTRDKDWQFDGVVPVQSLNAALVLGKEIAAATDGDEVCIIGGGQIYRQSLPLANVLHFTRVHAQPQGDTVFPEIDPNDWQEISSENVPISKRDTAETTYIVYKRVM